MRHLHSTVEEADLRIPVHVLDCLQAGYKTCVVISNYTDVIFVLLFHVPNFLQKGLEELWVQAGRGTATRFVPLHILHALLGSVDLCTVLPALHSLTGILVPRKRLSWLKNDPLARMWNNHCTDLCNNSTEQYLVNVVDVGSKSSHFQELREHQFHISKSISHQNLPTTSQGLEPPSYRAFYNAYITMHVLDAQLHVKTGDLDPVGLHLRMGIFCHQHCGKLWIHVGLWCVIVSKWASDNITENNTFITKINVHKIQTECSENHFAQIHVTNENTNIKVVQLGIRMAYWHSSCETLV